MGLETLRKGHQMIPLAAFIYFVTFDGTTGPGFVFADCAFHCRQIQDCEKVILKVILTLQDTSIYFSKVFPIDFYHYQELI